MNELIGLLKQIDFGTLDIDELLDKRDAEAFDAEWIRVYNAIESLKSVENYSEMEKKNNSKVREQVFRIIYELSNDGDLAGYVSDDLGLIADAELLGFRDSWLDKLISCYENKTIPCGSI